MNFLVYAMLTALTGFVVIRGAQWPRIVAAAILLLVQFMYWVPIIF